MAICLAARSDTIIRAGLKRIIHDGGKYFDDEETPAADRFSDRPSFFMASWMIASRLFRFDFNVVPNGVFFRGMRSDDDAVDDNVPISFSVSLGLTSLIVAVVVVAAAAVDGEVDLLVVAVVDLFWNATCGFFF